MNFRNVFAMTVLLFSLLKNECFCDFSLLEEMSLEEKVGQVLMVHFHGESVNEEATKLVSELKVGGIIYYNWSNGLYHPHEVYELSRGLQEIAKKGRLSIPLLIATDQEGGIVQRLQSGFTIFPGNRAVGEAKNLVLAKSAALAIAKELSAVGINMNLAPVADVNNNPKNPVIGIRSFGEDPEAVTENAGQFLEGFKEAGVIGVLKHFPGCGNISMDPHEDLPVITASKEELEKVELLPFMRLASVSDAIMTAHTLVPAFDEELCSTLSEKTLTYLRKEIGFQGLIIADSLVMKGVLKKCHSVAEASVMALNAGCDLLILGGKLLSGEHEGFELIVDDIEKIHAYLVEAVKSGRILESRLDEAVERVLKIKQHEAFSKSPNAKVQTGEHSALAEEIANLALQISGRAPENIKNLSDKNVLVISPECLKETLTDSLLLEIGKTTDALFLSGFNPSQEETSLVIEKAKKADTLIVCSYDTWKNPSVIALTHLALCSKKPAVFLSMKDPLDATLFPEADLIITSFGPTAPSIKAVVERLVER